MCSAQKQRRGTSRLNLPVELLEKLPCTVSCMFWGAWAVLVGSLRLSRFMFSTQASALTAACAEEVALFWCKALLETDDGRWDKLAEVLCLLKGPYCPASWDAFSIVFPLGFPVLLVESTSLSKEAGCLVSFALLFGVFRRALHAFLLYWTAWVLVLDCETGRGCSFSVVILELLGCDRLKGIGLVHGFFFLAFPCRENDKVLRI